MRRFILVALAALTAASIGAPSLAQPPPPTDSAPAKPASPRVAQERPAGSERPDPSEPSAAELAKLIKQLDSDRFVDRQRATKRLQDLGDSAFDALIAASSDPSYEVRRRAAWILRDAQERIMRAAFTEFARRPDEQLDVEHGMWLISRIVNPQSSRDSLTRQLDRLAKRVRERLGTDVDPRNAHPQVVVHAIRHVLFVEEKFIGNQADYTNPDNSSLERVLATRKGLPIVLSHIAIAVGERLGVPLVGVPTPGRYLVRYEGRRAPPGQPENDIYFDPFAGGTLLSLQQIGQQFPGFDPEDAIEAPKPRMVLVRMLNNLESHLYQRGDHQRAELALSCKLLLQEGLPEKDR